MPSKSGATACAIRFSYSGSCWSRSRSQRWSGSDPQVGAALILAPVAAVGHYAGMKAHEYLLERDRLFKRALGFAMIAIAGIGIARVLMSA